MEIADCLVAIAGDKRNTVPKYGVTAAEAAVLRYIHGDDAVLEINVTGEVTDRTHRQEIARLTQAYGRQEGERYISPAVSDLYPGAAARVFETFAELEIPEDFYAASGRKIAAPPKAAPAEAPADTDLSKLTVKELQAMAAKEGVDLDGITKKADIVEAIELAISAKAPEVEENDGTGEINDEFSDNLFK